MNEFQKVPIRPRLVAKPNNSAIAGCMVGFIIGVLFCLTATVAVGATIGSPQTSTPSTHLATSTSTLIQSQPSQTPVPTMSLHDGMTVVADKMTQTAVVPTPIWKTFESICESVDESNTTEVQMDALALSYMGTPINNWSGEVYDVIYDESGYYGDKGTYVVMISMVPDQWIFNRNVVIINLPQSVSTLNVHQVVRFSGVVRLVETSFNVMCNPITIESAEIYQ